MFKTMQGCINNIKIKPGECKKINNFIFQRYISGNPDGCMITSYANQFDLPSYALYELYRTFLSSKKIKYIKYYKDEKSVEDIEFLMEYYKCSRTVAESYLDILTPNQIEILKQSYGGQK